MRRHAGRLVLLALLLIWPLSQAHGQRPRYPPPPRPYADSGACPFEGCIYRNWVANQHVTVRTAHNRKAAVAFTLSRGDTVQALTGVVLTLVPGMVRLNRAEPLFPSADSTMTAQPSDTIFLLTYQGEGSWLVWFRGKLSGEEGYQSQALDECFDSPRRCALPLAVRPRSEWWAIVRDAKGRTGWVLVDRNFDNMDALGFMP